MRKKREREERRLEHRMELDGKRARDEELKRHDKAAALAREREAVKHRIHMFNRERRVKAAIKIQSWFRCYMWWMATRKLQERLRRQRENRKEELRKQSAERAR